jgi:endoglucanase
LNAVSFRIIFAAMFSPSSKKVFLRRLKSKFSPATIRSIVCLLVGGLGVLSALAAPPGAFTLRLAVDQFGYRPEMPKVAVISNPQLGFNTNQSYTPGGTLEVRTWSSNIVVFTGAPVAWNGGATHAQSGDKVWWFDFSSVTRWGEYYIYDPANDARSDRFWIDSAVYEDVLKQAARMYFYQRRGAAKALPYAEPFWTDGTNFSGPLQDTHCRLVNNPLPANEKDLRGGWFDAGDYNKYVNFTVGPISDLLFAYRQNPLIWPDNWNLPESGNGIPDLLDEVKWELDWLLRMQNANGSVLSKVGVNQYQGASPPSAESSQTFYGAESTSSTLSAAGNFAQAVRVYQSVGMTACANTLSNAAVAAYNWAVANPSVMFTNTGFYSANPEVGTGSHTYAYDRNNLQMRAAVFLYEITGLSTYRSYVEANYSAIQGISGWWWNFYENPIEDALLYYTTLPGVTPSVASDIRSHKQNTMSTSGYMGAWTAHTDAYQAYLSDGDYTWGSSQEKGHMGMLYDEQNTYALDTANASGYRAAAAGYLHYFHGVNPLTMVYLSNMYAHGATNCANQIYHSWFGEGTIYDDARTSPNGPAPGYVPGGANYGFVQDSAYAGPPLVPPLGQPPQKSYKDWNTAWPEDSWQITEPGIYYQAAYIYLLSRFVQPLTYSDWTTGYGLSGAAADPGADPDGDGVKNVMEYAFGLSPVTPDAAALPQFHLQARNVSGLTGTYLTVQFPRQMGATNLTVTVEASTNLLNWDPVCTIAGTNAPSGPGFVQQTGTGYQRQITARDTVPVESMARARFVRFKLLLN